jgi:hypothetical protein
MFGPPTILGLSHDYANLSKWLDDNLKPETAQEFRKPERTCFKNYYEFDNKDAGVYFKNGFKSIRDEVPNSVINNARTVPCLLIG